MQTGTVASHVVAVLDSKAKNSVSPMTLLAQVASSSSPRRSQQRSQSTNVLTLSSWRTSPAQIPYPFSKLSVKAVEAFARTEDSVATPSACAVKALQVPSATRRKRVLLPNLFGSSSSELS